MNRKQLIILLSITALTVISTIITGFYFQADVLVIVGVALIGGVIEGLLAVRFITENQKKQQ